MKDMTEYTSDPAIQEVRTFTVQVENEGTRADRFLAEMMPDQSRTYLQSLFKKDLVTEENRPVKSSRRLASGEELTVQVPAPVELSAKPEKMDLDILYEDEDLLIVNKPKGMTVHPAPGNYEHTLVNGLLWHCKGQLSGINGVLRPGIVHRIDKNTTGALIVCKNDRSHRLIAEQLKVHSITRKYRGICIGNLPDDSGTIEGNIGRNPKDRKKMAVVKEGGKPAVTHYRVLERFGDYTYCEFTLETGRTHQIRVHMASIGHPLLGDDVYGPARCPLHLEGQTLHAMTIGFIHPSSGKYVEFEAPLPDYFEKLLTLLRNKYHN